MSTPEAVLTKPAFTAEQAEEMFRKFLTNRNATPEQGGQQLYLDNYDLREKNRRLTEERDGLLARVPAVGTLVLAGDDLKLHNDLIAALAGKKPEEVVTLLKEHQDLQTKIQTLEREQAINRVAAAEGWKPQALLKLAANLDLVVEDVEEEQDDPENEGQKKKVKVPRGFVQTKAADGTITKVRVSEELKDFQESLKLDGKQTKESDSHKESPTTKFVKQSQGRKAVSNVSKDFISKRYATPEKK